MQRPPFSGHPVTKRHAGLYHVLLLLPVMAVMQMLTTSDVSKNSNLKAKDRTKDQTFNAKDRTKDSTLNKKDRTNDQGPKLRG